MEDVLHGVMKEVQVLCFEWLTSQIGEFSK